MAAFHNYISVANKQLNIYIALYIHSKVHTLVTAIYSPKD